MNDHDLARDIPARFEAEPGPSEELEARIRSALKEESSPRLPLRRRRLLAYVVIPCAVALVLAGRWLLFGRRPIRIDLGSVPPGQLVLELTLLAAVTVAATAVATRSGRHGLGPSTSLLAAACGIVVPAFVAVEVLWPLRAEDAESMAAVARLHPWGRPCVVIAALIGVSALTSLTWAFRHAVPVASRPRGAALGAASGAWVGFALFMHCPAADLTHVLVSHVAPVALFAVLGMLVVPPLLRP